MGKTCTNKFVSGRNFMKHFPFYKPETNAHMQHRIASPRKHIREENGKRKTEEKRNEARNSIVIEKDHIGEHRVRAKSKKTHRCFPAMQLRWTPPLKVKKQTRSHHFVEQLNSKRPPHRKSMLDNTNCGLLFPCGVNVSMRWRPLTASLAGSESIIHQIGHIEASEGGMNLAIVVIFVR